MLAQIDNINILFITRYIVYLPMYTEFRPNFHIFFLFVRKKYKFIVNNFKFVNYQRTQKIKIS